MRSIFGRFGKTKLVTEEKKMKEIFVEKIKNIDSKSIITDFFMVKSAEIKADKNGNSYLDLQLQDKTGVITAKKWRLSSAEADNYKKIGECAMLKIEAEVGEFNGTPQLNINKLKPLNKEAVQEEGLVADDFVKNAPEESESMYDFLVNRAEQITDSDLNALCLNVLEEEKEALQYYPAASKNHHSYRGGLLYHTKRMLMTGDKLCEVYTNLDKDLLATGVILHDMQKIHEIEANKLGVANEYSIEGNLIGHLVMGVRDLDKKMDKLQFPKEKKLLVEHMILSHHGKEEYGAAKKPMFPEAVILHYLDKIDADMDDMTIALKDTEPGAFSEKIWTLDNRKMYKKHE